MFNGVPEMADAGDELSAMLSTFLLFSHARFSNLMTPIYFVIRSSTRLMNSLILNSVILLALNDLKKGCHL
ncbi:hypothetical protein [Nostoc sp. NMS8]|uniref:hypothetical protein n=1 Tax=Nostoc sp. NMS8 TaxID=2815392 RepID=UPI0025DFC482|nr:hypothetical protein [Nostoc sp. NMS8]MBN3957474.1 hypothetical protein [Nostoc sp. NMS8]